ncbi:MAG TPA: hypothetical protein VGT78_01140 [Rhizomicrobium sp.]|nr:hypothetical protein [Rhizomicrobium sp.]
MTENWGKFLTSYNGQIFMLVSAGLAIIGFVLTLVTLIIDVFNFRHAVREFKRLTESVSTRFVGSFPRHILALAQLINEAADGADIEMLCDGVDYGSFAAPEDHKQLLRALINARSRGVVVKVLLWGPPQAMSIMNKYRDMENRSETTFPLTVNTFVASWRTETGFVNRLEGLFGKLDGVLFNLENAQQVSYRQVRDMLFKESFDDCKSLEFSATLTALQLCLHEWVYERLEDENASVVVRPPRTIDAEVLRTLTAVGLGKLIQEEINIRPGFFFWRVGNEAVYLMPVPGDDALAFRTRDSALVGAFAKIFQYETRRLLNSSFAASQLLLGGAIRRVEKGDGAQKIRDFKIYLFITLLLLTTCFGAVLDLPIKLCASAASVELTFLGYLLYWSEMQLPVPKRVRPQPITWALFGFTTGVAALVQAAQGSGLVGMFPLLVTSLGCFVIAVLTYKASKWRFTITHYLTISLVLVAMVFYVRLKLAPATTSNANLAAIFATVADVVAYWPSLTKAYDNPIEESPRNAFWNGVKFIPAYWALQRDPPIAAWLFMAIIGGFNIVYAGLLAYWRHRQRRGLWPFLPR